VVAGFVAVTLAISLSRVSLLRALPGVRDGVAGRERGGVVNTISWWGGDMHGVLAHTGTGSPAVMSRMLTFDVTGTQVEDTKVGGAVCVIETVAGGMVVEEVVVLVVVTLHTGRFLQWSAGWDRKHVSRVHSLVHC
jgi:hypothetical protein